MMFTFYSDEPHRGMEMFCDMCNDQWPDWYYRISKKDIYASYCVCETCMNEIKYEARS